MAVHAEVDVDTVKDEESEKEVKNYCLYEWEIHRHSRLQKKLGLSLLRRRWLSRIAYGNLNIRDVILTAGTNGHLLKLLNLVFQLADILVRNDIITGVGFLVFHKRGQNSLKLVFLLLVSFDLGGGKSEFTSHFVHHCFFVAGGKFVHPV